MPPAPHIRPGTVRWVGHPYPGWGGRTPIPDPAGGGALSWPGDTPILAGGGTPSPGLG